MNFPKPIFLTSKTVLHQENQRLQLNQEKLVAESAASIQALNERVRELQATVQATTDPLTNTSSTSNEHYTGNPYKTYANKIKALTEKYNGESDWGCMTARNIVDVRAAFIIGNGAKAIKQDGYTGTASRELEFIREFIRFNNLDKESPNDWAVGAELEGKALIRLIIDKAKKNIRTVYVPWSKYAYTVSADNPDLYHYTKAFYQGTDTIDAAAGAPSSDLSRDVSFNLNENEFVYVRFGGSSIKINEPIPKTALVLRQVEDLDKELWDWRKINGLFAAPTPVFMVETTDEAERLQAWITNPGVNWRIGKAIVIANGKFELVCYSGEGFTTLKNALEADVTTVSGSTGVPVHFLGHPELLSNRATAISLLELIEMSTNKERAIWEGGYEELFQKAIMLYNDAFHAGLNPDAVTSKIPFISSAKLEFIQKVYLPMYEANTISLETFLSYLTDIDVDEEVKRIESDKNKDDERNAANNHGADAGTLASRSGRDSKSRSAGGNKAIRS